MKKFLIALQFLTIIPVKIKSISEEELGKSLIYFPLVGAVVGLAGMLVYLLFSPLLPQASVAGLVLVTLIITSGGLHLDGFADTCDGLQEKDEKKSILEVMQQSHIRAGGIIGISFLLLLKFTLLASFPLFTLGKILIVMCTLGRWTQVLACSLFSYARESGKAEGFIRHAKRRELILASVSAILIALFLVGLKALLLVVVLSFLTFFSGKYMSEKIGGITGDTIGALSETAEVVVLLVCLIMI